MKKDESSRKKMSGFAVLRPKTYSYLIDNGDENKENKCHVDSVREDYKEFITNNRLMLRSQQRFRIEKCIHWRMYSLYLIFTEKISKIALSVKDDKRIQLILKKDIHGASKMIIHKNEEIKCSNIIKTIKEWLISMKLWKIKKNTLI